MFVMNILFIDKCFPGRFEDIAQELAKDSNNSVAFITNQAETSLKGVKRSFYTIPELEKQICHPYAKALEDVVFHGEFAADEALKLKEKGFNPDIIIGSATGASMFVKDSFPDVPYLCYFDWFNKLKDSVYSFTNLGLNEDQKVRLKCENSNLLIDLYSCDAGITPTKWQKDQFPVEFQQKIKVIPHGIDTEIFMPDKEAKFNIPNTDIELSAKDEVVTYGTKGIEYFRGFPEFIVAVEELLAKRPNAHFIITGEDKIFHKLIDDEVASYKQMALQNLNLDMNRVHFVGKLPQDEYVKLLQISSAHVYLTVPYRLSKSMLEAMATGCCVIGSNTSPVLEVIKDNENGVLVAFPDFEKLAEKVIDVLDNKDKMQEIRKNARKTILENYDIKKTLPQYVEYINGLIREKE